MTTPVRPTEIVLGKFLACFGVVALTVGFTLLYPAMLQLYGGSAGAGAPVEWRTVFSGYLGLLGWGAATVAIGLFVSSLTENQAVAALVTFAVLLLTWLAGLVGHGAGEALQQVSNDLSSITHLRGMAGGEIALKDLLYFASLTVLGLFLTQRAIESQRWS